MNKRSLVMVCAAAVLAAAALGGGRSQSRDEILQKAGLSAEARAAIITVGDDVRKLDKSHQAYVDAAQGLDALYVKLQQKVREVARLASEADKPDASRRQKLLEAVRAMAEMSQSFNIQYLDLQKQMQDENRRYTLVSNIMKTKHDTAKAAINNIR
jgi:septal ring factor EnvC (AmiA/AmiB activator)